MSKRDILESIYIDEVSYIYEQEKVNEIKRYQGMYNELISGLLANSFYKDEDKMCQGWFKSVVESINELQGDKKEESKKPRSKEDIVRELDKLRGLQQKAKRVKRT